MNNTLEAITFCKTDGARVSIPVLFMELRDTSTHKLSFDVQNFEVGHEHLWDFLQGFEGNGHEGKIELEYSDDDKHLYPCQEYHLNILQQGDSLDGDAYRMTLGRIDLKLGQELH